MIQLITFHVPYPGDKAAQDIDAKGAMIRRNKPEILGIMTGFADDVTMSLTLRVSGTDRWKCSAYAKKVVKFLLARHGLVKGEAPSPVSVITEKDLRALTLDEGRTVRDYPDRATRMRARREARTPVSS